MCAKVGCAPIVQLVQDVEFDEDGVPVDMGYDQKRKLYYMQSDIPPYRGTLADGTEVEMEGLKANLFDYFKVEYKVDEQQKPSGIIFSPCERKISKEKAVCGFFSSVMYKMGVDGAMALEVYKSRDEHEKNFDQLKNQMMNYNLRNSSEDGRNGRSFISFVGLIAISAVRHAWREKMRGRFESSLDMLDELESIRYSEYTDGTTHMSTFTAKQVEICDACNVAVPKECMPATVRKARERKEHPKKRGPKPKGVSSEGVSSEGT